jgi:hypothetical protein
MRELSSSTTTTSTTAEPTLACSADECGERLFAHFREPQHTAASRRASDIEYVIHALPTSLSTFIEDMQRVIARPREDDETPLASETPTDTTATAFQPHSQPLSVIARY